MIMKAFVVLMSFLVLGCGSEKAEKCEKYTDMEIKCGGYPASEVEMTRKMATGFCLEALGGEDLLNLKPEIACAQTHKDCSGYESCQTAAEAP